MTRELFLARATVIDSANVERVRKLRIDDRQKRLSHYFKKAQLDA
jgi:hypothetical protein